MAFDIAKNKRNRDAEEHGTWMDYGDGVRFLVARKTNDEYRTFISKQWRSHDRLLSAKNPSKQADKLAEKFMLEATARYILRDWEGLVNNGKDFPYTAENAVQFLEEYDDVRQDIEAYAEDRANYVAAVEAEDIENVKK